MGKLVQVMEIQEFDFQIEYEIYVQSPGMETEIKYRGFYNSLPEYQEINDPLSFVGKMEGEESKRVISACDNLEYVPQVVLGKEMRMKISILEKKFVEIISVRTPPIHVALKKTTQWFSCNHDVYPRMRINAEWENGCNNRTAILKSLKITIY